jgi:tetraprenyl-beta-curcumene synthase
VLVAVAARELWHGLPSVAREVRAWRLLASAIPDTPLRVDALSSLMHKRGHTDGAALFAMLPGTGTHNLLRLLVAYEIAWDFLDSVNEHAAAAGERNGRQLHLALIDALDPLRPMSAYYSYHPWKQDGGYLRTLVDVCRVHCQKLRSYPQVRPMLLREALRAQVLAINHDLDPERRDTGLRAWARRELGPGPGPSWFELSGASSASLTVHALLALGARADCVPAETTRIQRAYFPWISAATTMLDSFVDQLEDAANGDHSYVAHYDDSKTAVREIGRLLRRSLIEAGALDDAEHHVLIVACMIAMYLSKDSARSASLREGSRRLASASGSLTIALLPILRLWRVLYAQRST